MSFNNNSDSLRLIVFSNCKEFGNDVNNHLNQIKGTNTNYIVPIKESRFSNGEGKIQITETIRSKDLYIISDIGNHSMTYNMFGYTNHLGPDEHFQDIKRAISAIKGHAKKITVIMPLLYSSRQHKRESRESLDCAIALQELAALGVDSIITFDAHDPNVQNAVPCMDFENFYPTHTILEEFIDNEDIDLNNILIVSPDAGAMKRNIYYANMLNADVGMFYKRRDLTKVVDGKNPIVAHEYSGRDVAGKNIIVVDDMIASGDSILDVASELKKRGASKIFLISTFSFFTSGIKKFQDAYDDDIFDKIYSTDLSYVCEDAKYMPWFKQVSCSKYLANIINTLNSEKSISPLLNGKEHVLNKLKEKLENN